MPNNSCWKDCRAWKTAIITRRGPQDTVVKEEFTTRVGLMLASSVSSGTTEGLAAQDQPLQGSQMTQE
ncbi:hypothetical protein E2C01_039879 [Portunus trituberculatus]|uniref:Uncharacterized protein n=1 Tax=Portunus trituberculatus TaxID=210409 RepID=A0A5B7FLU9_PORTR|nr:hypothetical protein [Portunus trituberculatus]